MVLILNPLNLTQIHIICFVKALTFYPKSESWIFFLDWICTLRIIDDTYPSPGLTVNVYSRTLEQLPQIKNHDDMILFTRIKAQRVFIFLVCFVEEVIKFGFLLCRCKLLIVEKE